MNTFNLDCKLRWNHHFQTSILNTLHSKVNRTEPLGSSKMQICKMQTFCKMQITIVNIKMTPEAGFVASFLDVHCRQKGKEKCWISLRPLLVAPIFFFVFIIFFLLARSAFPAGSLRVPLYAWGCLLVLFHFHPPPSIYYRALPVSKRNLSENKREHADYFN